ncbi:hypothetical protein JDV02_001965 [Purpureocillium takamizusanense]|uniref:Uncharacterized protein n=1 Tax=Purpureocillium takamizusanense TaxID=2060973 RepID=A0A9Q8Q9E3_9HYPO|nr:uncharacterized protein JDV02_001965 [Purpureocillium takamizusanense]UNI15430.1 hypothetical protein JDV02_001965 [Purpureocillium takamizusanense]
MTAPNQGDSHVDSDIGAGDTVRRLYHEIPTTSQAPTAATGAPGLADAAIIINNANQLRDGLVTPPVGIDEPLYATCRQMIAMDPLDIPSHVHVGKGISNRESHATHRTTTVDNFDDRSVYSMSTAPRGGPMVQRQPRLEVTVPSQARSQSWSELNVAAPKPGGDEFLRSFPCEFRGLSNCSMEFAFDQVELWIQHIADDHLGCRFPHQSCCWFCSARFVAKTSLREDRSRVFRERMYHIADHLNKETTAADIRPDFLLLDHLWEYRIIDKETFLRAKEKSERPPMPRDITFGPPTATPPRGEMYPEERRDRHHPKGTTRRRTRNEK